MWTKSRGNWPSIVQDHVHFWFFVVIWILICSKCCCSFGISTLSNLIAELSLCIMAHDMLLVMSARCVARDLHTIAPRPLEHACWREFAAQWGDCKKSRIVLFNVNIIIIIVFVIIVIIIITCSCLAPVLTAVAEDYYYFNFCLVNLHFILLGFVYWLVLCMISV